VTGDREDVGLCLACVHVQRVPGKTRVYILCKKSREDPRFPKYPPLPVLQCIGFEERGGPYK